MASKKIDVYQGTTKQFTVKVETGAFNNLNGYSGLLSVKESRSTPDSLLTKVPTIATDASTMNFALCYTDTSINPGIYFYDIVIDNCTNRYTALQDLFEVVDSVRY